ncbi:MAG: hypothetical protein ACOC4G_10785 [Bacillota bacterium]
MVVPTNILNKTANLDDKEWTIMKTHTYYTYHSLEALKINIILNNFGKTEPVQYTFTNHLYLIWF